MEIRCFGDVQAYAVCVVRGELTDGTPYLYGWHPEFDLVLSGGERVPRLQAQGATWAELHTELASARKSWHEAFPDEPLPAPNSDMPVTR